MSEEDAPVEPSAGSPTGAILEVEDDAEFRAAQSLHKLIQGSRRRASLLSLLTGLVLGIVLVVAAQSFLAEQLGPRFGMLALVIVFFAPLLVALTLAQLIADAIVKSKIGGWVAQVAKEHGVAPATLEDHARIAGIDV